MADAPAPAAGGAAPKIPGSEKVVNPTTVLILGFVTCGLYCLYWMWLRVKEMNEYLGKQQVNPMFVFPGCICYPVFWYASWLYVNGLPEMQKKAGLEAKDEKVMQIVLLILLAPVGQYMIQQKLNEIWAKTGAA
jgi:hypothetical protein